MTRFQFGICSNLMSVTLNVLFLCSVCMYHIQCLSRTQALVRSLLLMMVTTGNRCGDNPSAAVTVRWTKSYMNSSIMSAILCNTSYNLKTI